MAYLEDDRIDEKARNFRQEIGIDDRAVPDMIFALNEMKRLGKLSDYLVREDEDLQGVAAKYDSDTRTIYISRSTFNALDFPNYVGQQERRRSRFTVAHEIAHAILDHDGTLNRGPSDTPPFHLRQIKAAYPKSAKYYPSRAVSVWSPLLRRCSG